MHALPGDGDSHSNSLLASRAHTCPYVCDRAAVPASPQTEALATAAVRAATKLQAALIVVFTVTGRTARLIAKYRPQQPILTVSSAVYVYWFSGVSLLYGKPYSSC